MRLTRIFALSAVAVLAVAPLARAQDQKVEEARVQDERSPNMLTEEEKAAGWKLLFDGKTTDGWRNFRKDTLSDGWKVVDGALTKTSPDAGDIVYNEEFSTFELVIEYRIGKGGNSGMMYHVLETKRYPWQTGPEVQIQDNVDGHDPQKSGWLYQLYTTEKDATRPAGEWNEIRLLITPEKCEQYMNGVKYCEYVKGSDDWKERVAKSKFGQMEGFGEATSGFICLQGDHQGDLAFRNIRIRKVEPAPATEAKSATADADKSDDGK